MKQNLLIQLSKMSQKKVYVFVAESLPEEEAIETLQQQAAIKKKALIKDFIVVDRQRMMVPRKKLTTMTCKINVTSMTMYMSPIPLILLEI